MPPEALAHHCVVKRCTPAVLTQGAFLQRGVDLPSLDVTYFTSLSYYILLLFGLNGLLRMLFRDQASPCKPYTLNS